jgi:hypothetical protein
MCQPLFADPIARQGHRRADEPFTARAYEARFPKTVVTMPT